MGGATCCLTFHIAIFNFSIVIANNKMYFALSCSRYAGILLVALVFLLFQFPNIHISEIEIKVITFYMYLHCYTLFEVLEASF